jgi:hypothetical protein
MIHHVLRHLKQKASNMKKSFRISQPAAGARRWSGMRVQGMVPRSSWFLSEKGMAVLPILILNYSKLGQRAFATKFTRIAQCLTNNPHYPTPWAAGVPSPETLSATARSYVTAVSDAESGDRQKIAFRNDLRATGQGQIKVAGHYLMATTPGNLTALESTGYDLRHESVKPIVLVPPAAPVGLKVKRGIVTGTAYVTAAADTKATHYLLESTSSDPTVEANFGNPVEAPNCNRIELYNLTALKTYVIRLRAYNKAGWGPRAVSAPIVIL